jgi:hypothetical protein
VYRHARQDSGPVDRFAVCDMTFGLAPANTRADVQLIPAAGFDGGKIAHDSRWLLRRVRPAETPRTAR